MFHQSEKFHEYETSSNQIAVQSNIRKYQGYLLKKKKVVGFKPYFVVLYRGNLIYYKNDSDAKQDLNRKRTLSLENAIITIDVKINKTLNKFQHSYACCAFAVRFRTGKTHLLYSFPLETKDTKRRSITHLQKILYQNSLDIARERKTKWSCALQQHIEYVSKAQEIERLGLKINVQIENVEKHLMIFREKLANIYMKPEDDDNQSSTSSDDDDDDFDSQIGSSVNESFDTAEEFTDDDSDDTMMDDDEKDSGRQSGLSVQVVNNQNKVFSQGGFGIDLQSWRTRLPCKMVDRSQISIWSIAKQFIGKELARLSIPAVLCEPLSFLQRVGESVQYARLLTRAVQCADDPCKRIELVSAFLFSVLGCVERMAVPFTPVLGETYELVRHDLGYRIIIEHVSAHPPMSAYRCESIDTQFKWSISGHLSAKFKFWGRSVEIETKGFNQLEFPTLNEIYTWRPVSYCIHAVILGPSWLEHYNNVEISCNNGFKSVLNFKPTSSYNKENHRYDGYIYDNKMNKVKAVYGVWMKSFYSCEAASYDHYLRANKKLPTPTHEMGKSATEQQINEIGQETTQQPIVHYAQSTGNIQQQRNSDVVVMRTHRSRSDDPTTPSAYFNLDDVGMEKEKQSSLLTLQQALQMHQPPVKDFAELWVAFDQPSYETDYYWFSYLAMSLNELNEELERTLPQTDSRYRPDIRCLETGDIDGASREKQSVEDRQREAVKSRNKEEYRPLWFQLDLHPQLNEDVWVFNHKYWNRNFANCPNLFLKK